jgi:hypothetical protein
MRVIGIFLSLVVVCGCGSSLPDPTIPTPTLITCATCPSITSLSPNGVVAGSPDLTVHFTGTNFTESGHVKTLALWSDDVFLNTTILSSTELTTIIPASLLHDPGVATILLVTMDVMADDGNRSNAVSFTVSPPAASR